MRLKIKGGNYPVLKKHFSIVYTTCMLLIILLRYFYLFLLFVNALDFLSSGYTLLSLCLHSGSAKWLCNHSTVGIRSECNLSNKEFWGLESSK